jgi:hypothetical protein
MAAAGIQWDAVVLAPFAEYKVSATREPATLEEAVQRFVQTKVRSEEWDTLRLLAPPDAAASPSPEALIALLQAQVAAALAPAAAPSPSPASSSSSSSLPPALPEIVALGDEATRERLPFQWIVAELFLAMYRVPCLAPVLRAIRADLRLPADLAAPVPRQVVVAASISAALEWLARRPPPARALVTGSLYLVGGVLQSVGWRAEAEGAEESARAPTAPH